MSRSIRKVNEGHALRTDLARSSRLRERVKNRKSFPPTGVPGSSFGVSGRITDYTEIKGSCPDRSEMSVLLTIHTRLAVDERFGLLSGW